MNKLGEEWKKRETERHELFKKKLDQYTMLEKRLVEGLQKLQLHQQNVSAKEKKVSGRYHSSIDEEIVQA